MELPLHIYPAGASDLDAALAQPGTKVLMKSGKAIGETAAALSRHGLAEDSAMVADCGLPTQQVFETMTGPAGEDQLFCHGDRAGQQRIRAAPPPFAALPVIKENPLSAQRRERIFV